MLLFALVNPRTKCEVKGSKKYNKQDPLRERKKNSFKRNILFLLVAPYHPAFFFKNKTKQKHENEHFANVSDGGKNKS